jgi:hypothetical protein
MFGGELNSVPAEHRARAIPQYKFAPGSHSQANFVEYTPRSTYHGYSECGSNTINTNSVALVRERTIPTERMLLLGEVSANCCG